MLKGKWCIAIVASALFAALALPAAGFATGAKVIVMGKGVADARIGMLDDNAVVKLKNGEVRKEVNDVAHVETRIEIENEVEHVVEIAHGELFHDFLGHKVGDKFGLEVHADAAHRVFQFVIRDKAFKTANGIHVGSTEAQLKKHFKVNKKVVRAGTFKRFQVGRNTFFFVKAGKVRVIKIVK